MWTVVYTAQYKDVSEKMCDALRNNGILVKVICICGENKYDILVPYTEVEQAHNVLIDITF